MLSRDACEAARGTAGQRWTDRLRSNFGIEIEERLQARSKLLLDFFLAAFKYMHSNVRLSSIGELYRSLTDLHHIFRRQQTHAIYQG